MHTRRVACLIFCTIPLWPRYCRESQRGNARSLATGWLDVKPAASDWKVDEENKRKSEKTLKKNTGKVEADCSWVWLISSRWLRITHMFPPVLGLHVCKESQLSQLGVPAIDQASMSYCHIWWLPGRKSTKEMNITTAVYLTHTA